jgi:hypothetical protein
MSDKREEENNNLLADLLDLIDYVENYCEKDQSGIHKHYETRNIATRLEQIKSDVPHMATRLEQMCVGLSDKDLEEYQYQGLTED